MRAVHRRLTWCTTMTGVRVLVIEDEAKLASVIARGLREEGYAVDIAGRGEDALWMARAAAYDAILLDVMLPGATASTSAAGCAGWRSGARCSC